MKFPSIYLASASPRRHEILLRMGVDHEILAVPAPPGEDEPRLPGEAAAVYVRRTAREKALRARAWLAAQGLGVALRAERPILAADTTVILGGDILGKPDDAQHARQLLARLSGNTHAVHTAVALAAGGRLLEDVSITEVRFKTLTAAEIDDYCASGEPMGKAGAYGIQGKAGMFVAHLSGSYTGVMGLPMFETARLLGRLGGSTA
ncbi:Maf family protein [Parapusillimonas granuli]|uniref:dTTP/UTP pyrophosphatase n=1 Tax=Parapusillimonas granuli TaxID=380911 RepID=A0A853G5T2_9BURK|nr:Maf family protein [Parapusillimonas granuli]MBB5217467.1 septum formation protein [Parapusillimonas granuli]MEB2401754.1 Maf family protein [Alcaligenaceae bacterium]NYT50041.1 septum formation inhibitor Maf [Parapusillimonas granuli]